MPKKVHKMVNEMLANPDFYPEKSKKQQEAIAWATAWSQYKKKKKKKANSEYSKVRQAELINLDREINLLEKHGLIKEAQILDNKFQKLAQTNSDVLTVESADNGFQIMLNGNTPYKKMTTGGPVIFNSLEQAQKYAQKLADSEDYIFKP